MSNILKNKNVLVTGGTGSIGSEIVAQALDQGAAKVIVFSRDEIKHYLMKKRIVNDRLETIVGDVRTIRSLRRAFEKYSIDIIYHAAAMKHVVMCEDFPAETVETNILGTQNVVDTAIEYGASKMITISTDKAAYPTNVMGATKFIAEKITLNANKASKKHIIFSCVRFGNVASSRGSVIPTYIENLMDRKPLQVTDRKVTRFMIEIPEAVKLIIRSTELARGGEIFLLKMKSFRLGDMIDVIVNEIAPLLKIPATEIDVNDTGLVSGEKLHEDLITSLETDRLFELEDVYIIVPDEKNIDEYPIITKPHLCKYNSSEVEMISKQDLKLIIIKYLNQHRLLKNY